MLCIFFLSRFSNNFSGLWTGKFPSFKISQTCRICSFFSHCLLSTDSFKPASDKNICKIDKYSYLRFLVSYQICNNICRSRVRCAVQKSAVTACSKVQLAVKGAVWWDTACQNLLGQWNKCILLHRKVCTLIWCDRFFEYFMFLPYWCRPICIFFCQALSPSFSE